MTVESLGRAGTARLARLGDLPSLERRVVRAARLWRGGPSRRDELDRWLADRHGPAVGRTAHARLDDVLRLACEHARRPLAFSAVGDEDATGDECVLARLVGLAAEGAREEAILIAALMIRADLALELARRAMALGHQMMRRPGAVVVLPG